VLDLAAREWAEPLRDPGETYIWNLTVGSDGLIYGGTYPGCVLLRYDPEGHHLENLGRASDHADNLYSRMVYGGIPGHILVSCGTAEPHLALWSMETGEFRRFGRPGAAVSRITDEFIGTQTGGEVEYYDLRTLERLSRPPDPPKPTPTPCPQPYPGTQGPLRLSDGRCVGVRGQEYFIGGDEAGAGLPPLRPIPVPRPTTHILTLIADDEGGLWGSAGFGQTIFRYDPATGESWNSQVVSTHSRGSRPESRNPNWFRIGSYVQFPLL
jgi:hypothetical protein